MSYIFGSNKPLLQGFHSVRLQASDGENVRGAPWWDGLLLQQSVAFPEQDRHAGGHRLLSFFTFGEYVNFVLTINN